MIKYRANNVFVDKDVFYEELKKAYDIEPQKFGIGVHMNELVERGYTYIILTSAKPWKYRLFCIAEEEVFEMEDIIWNSSTEIPISDAFESAYKLYKQGFRKIENINPTE
mgnify:CR=1 FL=1